LCQSSGELGAIVEHIELFILLLIIAAVVAVVAQFIRLPYTIALLLLGLGLGIGGVIPELELDAELILLLFLPPLIFEAAFVLNLSTLWDRRVEVTTLALPGVMLAMAVGGTIVHTGSDLPWDVALLFGAMIAATDPVAVLATFRHLKVDLRLSTLLEAESLFNDGVALALLVALEEAVRGEFHLGVATGNFLLAMVGGTIIGVAAGWIGHRLIALLDDHLTEMTISVAVAYGAFLGASELDFSGVLATLFAAMVLGHLGRTQGWVYSGASERVLVDLWEFLAFVANAALFVLMGLTVRISGLADHPGDVAWGIAAALVGRAAVAYGLGAVINWNRSSLPRREQHVLFWGGLRGVVALAAALSLPDGFPYQERLLAMTYGVVLFTALAQGLTIPSLIRRLGLGGPVPGAAATDAERLSAVDSVPT
jgi:CPA1 family monovalent cation:H+ antiporter